MVVWQVEAFIIDDSHTTQHSVKLQYLFHMTVKYPFKQYYSNQNPRRVLVSYHIIYVLTFYHPAVDVGWFMVM